MQWRQSENVETNFLFFLEIFIGLREGGRRRKGLGKFKTRRKNKWTGFFDELMMKIMLKKTHYV